MIFTLDNVKWTVANKRDVPETTFAVKGLTQDAIYEFRVLAENRAGVGPASDVAESRARTPVGACCWLSHVVV